MAKKYYWLKLKEDFFNDPDIKLIKSQKDGKDFLILYLQLQLLSLRGEGILRHKDIIPYTSEMLSTLTDTPLSIVTQGIKLFINLGMIEKWDDGTLYMLEMQKLIGHESESAERVRKHRADKKALQCNNEVTKSNTEIEYRDRDRDRDREKKKEIEIFFEKCWKMYPKKEGKGSISLSKKKELFKLNDEFIRCIERYKTAKKGTDRKYLKNGSTFFNSGYVDYLDENYNHGSKSTVEEIDYSMMDFIPGESYD